MTSKQELPDDDDEAAAVIVQRLKSQGIFDSMRRECLADIDTKPAFLNLSQRIERYVSNFLDRQEWRQDLNKNQLRERLRRNLTESNMMKYGVDHLVDGAVQAKRRTFMPEVEKAVKEMMGIEEEEEIVDWPNAAELKSEPDVDNSQQDMDVDDDSGDEGPVAVKPEAFIPSFVEVQDSTSQSSSSPPPPSKSIIQQLFEPVIKREDEKCLTPTKISIQLNINRNFAEDTVQDKIQIDYQADVEGDKLETVDMDEDSRPSSANSISNIQLPSSPPPASFPPPPPLQTIPEEVFPPQVDPQNLSMEEPSIVIKNEMLEGTNYEQAEDLKQQEAASELRLEPSQTIKEEVSKDDVPPLEYLSDVSSVHTSDLSDFDGRISPDSSCDEDGKVSPKKESPAKIKKEVSRKSKDSESRKRRSVDNQQPSEPSDSRPSTSSGRRERKVNPKYASDDYASIYNRGKSKIKIEEDISSDEDFDVEAESSADKSTPVQDEFSNDGSTASVKKVDGGEDMIADQTTDLNVDEQEELTNKSQLKNVKRKVSRRQERYDASDLYKPRPVIGSSRRSRNANAD